MKIALITEGTYPFHGGGVSVWCEQLVEGLPEHSFQVHSIGGITETKHVTLSANVTQLTQVPLWDTAQSGRRGTRRANRAVEQAFADLAVTIVNPEADDAVAAFGGALKRLFLQAADANLSSILLSNESISRLCALWQQAGTNGSSRAQLQAMTFADALTALNLLEHFLRPLSLPAPQADVVHAVSNGLAGLLGLTSRWAHGTPFLLTEHGLYLRERYLHQLQGPETYPVRMVILSFFKLLASTVYRHADLIRPGSAYNQRWQLQGGASPERMATIYNGIDPALFPVASDEPALPTISWLGRIDPIKDLHTLIHAFAIVSGALPAARLRIFGSAPKGGQQYLLGCRQLAEELGLAHTVTFEGRVNEPADAYHAGTIVVLSSISEGFPYTVLEAMACGRAVVATRVGGVEEAVGDSGLLVPPRDPKSLARACLALLNDQPLRQSLAQNATLRVAANFSLAQSLAAYRSTYSELSAPAPEQIRSGTRFLSPQAELLPA